MTIFANDGLGLLQMISEPDIERCASEDDRPQRRGTSANKDTRPQRKEWIVRSHIDWRGVRVSVRTLGPEWVD